MQEKILSEADIRKLMIDFKLNNADLARAMGVTPEYVSMSLNDDERSETFRKKLVVFFLSQADQDINLYDLILRIKRAKVKYPQESDLHV